MSEQVRNTHILQYQYTAALRNKSHHYSQNSIYVIDHSLFLNTNLFVHLVIKR